MENKYIQLNINCLPFTRPTSRRWLVYAREKTLRYFFYTQSHTLMVTYYAHIYNTLSGPSLGGTSRAQALGLANLKDSLDPYACELKIAYFELLKNCPLTIPLTTL